eukprot:TRINITY_DN53750_c0_g1_i1.p1 TRINITY_DN53750_c0_g1~~TRINITY_DN53750_c0_g1_i1.p1  ORF type:complete len:125 (+),score=15.84 TRINITY_DN53750_c0_g1_i1:356-730(+)
MLIPVWSSNPSFYGCWSNIAVGTSKANFQLMQQEIGGLFFAGEATDYDYNGFVAGGYHSGKREAEKVLEVLRQQSSEPSELNVPGLWGSYMSIQCATVAGALAALCLVLYGFANRRSVPLVPLK